MTRLCSECLQLLAEWNAATEQLTDSTSALTGLAIVGDIRQHTDYKTQVEAARLRVENARSALQLHRSTHTPADHHTDEAA